MTSRQPKLCPPSPGEDKRSRSPHGRPPSVYFLMISTWTLEFFSISAENCAVSRMNPRS
jgi:hypothetical protein